MSSLALSSPKRKRLQALSNPNGIIAALAMDQRKSLRRMIAHAAKADLTEITDERLVEFKSAITRVLSMETSAILLDPEYGIPAAKERAESCGLMLAYEMDGYENPRPHRMLALLPNQSVRRLRDLGAEGIKILLHYAPHDLPAANDEKCALIERIGNECEALGLPFFLEPVVYDPNGLDQHSLEFAKRKPQWVVDTVREFSKDVYKVDILKVEFPVIAAYVEGCAVYTGQRAYTLDEALEWFRAADAAARRPYIYLSAGVSSPEFLESLRLALRAEARFSGVLCGRANWQHGVRAYARSASEFHPDTLTDWLHTSGLQNVRAINELLRSATPWQSWFQDRQA
ncbi:MAG: tagatose 1,6-diphosphate aldolase [Acidobacteriaceae bacterium]|nr:tagatose 1,6-diphosphate aldolase [Acidobacteriaceae bacterium]